MATLYTTQKALSTTLSTPLGPDALILDHLEGVEGLSIPFEFTFSLHAMSASVDFAALVGKSVQAKMDYKDGQRYFSGVVGEIHQRRAVPKDTGYQSLYEAKIYPRFWLLKFTCDHRIFQEKTTIDIILAVLREKGVTQLEDKTTSCGKGVRDYCVQYRESAFDFVSRLMEEEGIFYYFRHSASGETMVLADAASPLEPALEEAVKVIKTQASQPLLNTIQWCGLKEQVVSQAFETADYNFETATVKLFSKVAGQGIGDTVYRYPGLFMKSQEGDMVANHRIEELEWAKKTLEGESTAPLFTPGFKAHIIDHPQEGTNGEYILFRVYHRLNQQATPEELIYQNHFWGFPVSTTFRPPLISPKPRIYGTQTAVVTGPEGEEIFCDEYGRIKVRFHWDQAKNADEDSSCWIRVAQLWASSGWGAVFTPRIGQEVVVTFLEGDPDRPLITGCVYNSKNKPPYTLPAQQTKSTIRSDSSLGHEGFNELRFEDKAGKEQIFIHAQKDLVCDVINDRTTMVEQGQDTLVVMKGNQAITIAEGNRVRTVTKGNDILKVGGKRAAMITDAEIRLNEATYSQIVAQVFSLVAGNMVVIVGGSGGDQGEEPPPPPAAASAGDSDNFSGPPAAISAADQAKEGGAQGAQTASSKASAAQSKVDASGKIRIKGNGDEGTFIIDVDKDIKLLAAGDITIKATGKINIEAGSDISMKADGKISLQSGTEFNIQAGTAFSLKSGTQCSFTAGTNYTVSASVNYEVSANANLTLSGQANTTVSAGANLALTSQGNATLNSQGMATVHGGGLAVLKGDGGVAIG